MNYLFLIMVVSILIVLVVVFRDVKNSWANKRAQASASVVTVVILAVLNIGLYLLLFAHGIDQGDAAAARGNDIVKIKEETSEIKAQLQALLNVLPPIENMVPPSESSFEPESIRVAAQSYGDAFRALSESATKVQVIGRRYSTMVREALTEAQSVKRDLARGGDLNRNVVRMNESIGRVTAVGDDLNGAVASITDGIANCQYYLAHVAIFTEQKLDAGQSVSQMCLPIEQSPIQALIESLSVISAFQAAWEESQEEVVRAAELHRDAVSIGQDSLATGDERPMRQAYQRFVSQLERAFKKRIQALELIETGSYPGVIVNAYRQNLLAVECLL